MLSISSNQSIPSNNFQPSEVLAAKQSIEIWKGLIEMDYPHNDAKPEFQKHLHESMEWYDSLVK